MTLSFPAIVKAMARLSLKEQIEAEIHELVVKEMQRALLGSKAQREADLTSLVREAVHEAVAELLPAKYRSGSRNDLR